jgi:hypothetical protein
MADGNTHEVAAMLFLPIISCILGYLCIGWEWFGLIIPQYIHLVMDWIF